MRDESALAALFSKLETRNSKLILNDGCVFTVQHEERLFDDDSFDFVGEDREWIKTKARLIFVALRVNDARVLIRGQLVAPPVNDECLFQFREHDEASDRRLRRGDEQAVIASRVEASDS